MAQSISIFLADDDLDDCFLFEEALSEIPIAIQLTIVHDGVDLMQRLTKEHANLPHVLFIDLNMPRKNGMECLEEIKKNENLSTLNVIVLSTGFHKDVATQLFELGAKQCIQKPSDLNMLKELIHAVLKGISRSPGVAGNTSSQS